MMIYRIRTVAYFVTWGLIYGLLLGAFSGTAILPMLGTMYSVIWGTGIGLACGVLSGVVVAIAHLASFHSETDLDPFRRRLSFGIGTLIAAAAPLILYATSRGVLWDSGLARDMEPFTALSLFSASFWGLLSSAYTASRYPAFIAQITAHREYEGIEFELPQEKHELFHTMRHLLQASITRQVYLFGALAGGILYPINEISRMYSRANLTVLQVLGFVGAGAVLAVIITTFIAIYAAFGNAALLTFLKRLIFREYFPALPQPWYRGIMAVIAFLFTAATAYWTLPLAPIIGLIAAIAVYRLTGQIDDSLDKAKRKEKHSLALEDAISDAPMFDDVALAQIQEQERQQ